MDIQRFAYLWDGSAPGWVLHHIEHTVWHVVFVFEASGPDQAQILTLRQLLPELQEQSLPAVSRTLKGCRQYRTVTEMGNIEARRIQGQAQGLGLHFHLEWVERGGYVPVSPENKALLIEDDALARAVVAKMMEAGVPVRVMMHVD